MKVSSINVINVNTKLHETVVSKHKMSVHQKVKYDCNQCEYKATQKNNLKTHKISVHECKKYSCNQCDYKASQKVTYK